MCDQHDGPCPHCACHEYVKTRADETADRLACRCGRGCWPWCAAGVERVKEEVGVGDERAFVRDMIYLGTDATIGAFIRKVQGFADHN